MIPQNGQQTRQTGVPFLQAGGQEGGQLYSLDPSAAAKQMAALNAANLAKMSNRSAPGGTSVPFLGTSSLAQQNDPNLSFNGHDYNIQAQPHPHPFPQSPDLKITHPPPANPALMLQQQQQAKRRNFLVSLAQVHNHRNAPLPPTLTGIPSATYDPTTSPWKALDISQSDAGLIRVAGKEVDLFRLWTLVNGAGGAQKLNEQNGWPTAVSYLGLPDQVPSPTGPQLVAPILAQYYNALFSAFDDVYKRNVQAQQQRGFMTAAAQAQAHNQGRVPPPSMTSQPGRMSQPGMGMPSQSGLPAHMNAMPSGSSMNMGMNMMAMMGQQPTGPAGSPPHPSASGFMAGQGMPHTPRQPSQPPQSATPMQPPDGRPSLSVMSSSDALSASSGLPQQFPQPTATFPSVSQSLDVSFSGSDFDSDTETRKRKMREVEELDGKRARQKTVGPEATDSHSTPVPSTSSTSSAGMARPRQQPSRRKIEYVPYRRELETHGGRDLKLIEDQLAMRTARGHGIREIHEWGNVDIEALTMSLRSRLTMELSYALTTLTILSIMRGQTATTGFPIYQVPDLVDETLDLLEEMAFEGQPDAEDEALPDEGVRIVSHRDLVKRAQSDGSQPFAALVPVQGAKDDGKGPRQRPGDVILTIVNIYRNMSQAGDNVKWLAEHTRMFSLFLRICGLVRGEKRLRAASSALTLSDLVTVRKDVVNILLGTGAFVHLSPNGTPTKQELLNARRVYELLSSFLVDPTEAVAPMTWVRQAGEPPRGSPKPSSTVDLALDVMTRIFVRDFNRGVLAVAVPQHWLWCLLEALVHRLPVTNEDYQLFNRDSEFWLSYAEKTLLALYCIAFMAPPEMKKRAKTDRRLGLSKVLSRLVKVFMTWHDQTRVWFTVSARRAIETLKILDDGEDPFETDSASAAPVLAFGMGFADAADANTEKGTGLLAGHRQEFLWDVMAQKEVLGDEVMFIELDSLTRVG
ncbi:hypothetical protein NEOLEDRAFT_1082167 [Neolentinus lepideus HHB14362 ss-1]|uniref:ARID domain-containing protein n=1 Tax=Neolentinus lepideus HHB14362 ss-1 TaxID=1314782 RepID=A0A165VXM3_9AGAM|nr:hypothetical protein NEOLEDRAFT_1082167 [Neolentinus lepideus HHB14362 ss-1]